MRLDVFDVLVGINLLREGLDIPDITLVAILDADKEGFLRSETSLIQTIGRAARNSEGHVIMYADNMTDSMHKAITELPEKIQEIYKLSLSGESNEAIAAQLHLTIDSVKAYKKRGKQILKKKLQNLLLFLSVTL